MSFSKNDLEDIKTKISIRSELEKNTKLIQKGRDFWCCCPFHEEKTPSCKINEDQNSFYCFGCGAKGDIFTLYTDLYKYNFIDAVKELSQRVGIIINFNDTQKTKEQNQVENILKLACEWYEKNLEDAISSNCNSYIKKRKLSKETVKEFNLGYSYNQNSTLYEFLKNKSFNDEDLLKSNVIKLNKNKKIRDYFYKRLIFPIKNAQGKVVGFGGRALDDSNPKYINSPESSFFQKRNLLYNLDKAKNFARKKNNLLICEGYMDVISLSQNGIHSVVAPLGTALTDEQLNLSWKYSSKPTIMFDGDNAGLRASYKTAIMSLPLISADKFIQFISLPEGYDPDSYINKNSFKKLVEKLKEPESLINFIFNHSSETIQLEKTDEKISYDKYLDDLIDKIKDKKTKYFYQREVKSLFFSKLRQLNIKSEFKIKKQPLKKININLNKKQNMSFIASAINHISVRNSILNELVNSNLFDESELNLIYELKKKDYLNLENDQILTKLDKSSYAELLSKSLSGNIYDLFPYSSPIFDPQESYKEVLKSINNLNTRLSNLKKINKSLNKFVENSNTLNWSELKNINLEIIEED